MRKLAFTTAAAGLSAALAACGGSGGQASGPPAEPAPTPAQMQARLATLPAPYNAADLANGQAQFALCASCHTITPGGPNMTGPNLWGVVGRKAGTAANFNYSDPLKSAGWIWDPARLDPWVANPRAVIPQTRMSFIGLRDAKDRTDVIAYLMVNTPAK